MAGVDTIARKVAKEIGKRVSKLAVKKAGARFVGHMARNSSDWRKAFQHIAEHFKTNAEKAAHTVFLKKYRSEAAVKALIKEAASKPSRVAKVTKLTVGNQNIGRPGVIIERTFKEAIGEAGGEACHVLRIVIDYTGRPITAYPVASAVAVVAGVTILGGESEAEAGTTGSPIDLYTALIAAEGEAARVRADADCDSDTILGDIVDFIFDPSCISRDPHERISEQELLARTNTIVLKMQAANGGYSLDDQTVANIRQDVMDAWGVAYRYGKK